MNVKWEDVKEDFARKDAEIEKLKAMNAELVEALEEIIGSGQEVDDIELMKEIAVDALAKAKELSQ
jgi:hypothetical protein